MHPPTEEPDEVDETHLAALLSEAALSEWNLPEEDEAWSHLQAEGNSPL